jgi:hypothetical protein
LQGGRVTELLENRQKIRVQRRRHWHQDNAT